MAIYTFDEITAAQAGSFTTSDLLVVRHGTASATTVIFNDNATMSLTIEGRTVQFDSSFPAYADGTGTNIEYPDGSILYVGRFGDDRAYLPKNISIPTNGAAYGWDGDDFIDVHGGSWLIQGNQGNDRLRFGTLKTDSATIYGGQGNDSVEITGFGSSFVQGNKGDDSIVGGSGAETLIGGQGNDRIAGSGGADIINGNLGDDQIEGGGLLFGEAGNDTIRGLGTNDRIDSGVGADSLSGGGGADVFIQTGSAAELTLAAADRIGDWAGDDKIQLRAAIGTAYAEITATDYAAALADAQQQIGAGQVEVVAVQVGVDIIIFADASAGSSVDTITVLVGRTLTDISASNFV